MNRQESAEIRARATALHEEAVKLDADAEAQLRMDYPQLRVQLHHSVSTRAPVREYLRQQARENSPAAYAMFSRADTLYWCVVALYRGFIAQQARGHAIKSRTTTEEVESVLLLGAFDAAVSWQPVQGAFTTYAAIHLYMRWQRANDRQSAVALGQSRTIRAEGGFGKTTTISLDAASPDHPESSLLDTLVDEARFDTDPQALLAFAAAARLLTKLPEKPRRALLAYAHGEPIAETAAALKVHTRQVQGLVQQAVQLLRVQLQPPGPVPKGLSVKTGTRGRPKKVLPVSVERAEQLIATYGVRGAAKALGMSHQTLYTLLREATPASDARGSEPRPAGTPSTPDCAPVR